VSTQAGSRIRAAVPWYGPHPPEGVENIAAPVFAIYGELDQRINAGIEMISRQMQSHGKPFTHTIYPGAQHAFNNDTNPERYHPEQARIAWTAMLEFFARPWRAERQRTHTQLALGWKERKQSQKSGGSPCPR
jgi:carboxymethylenebutenolidase